MNRFNALCMLVLTLSSPVAVLGQPTLSIDRIVADSEVSGRVMGVPAADATKFKVLLYVRTDRWYIHPYAGQGEGKSWATVAGDGRWKISTVKREFAAESVAALLVERSFPEPAIVQSLTNIPSAATVTRTLRGTPDHGKL